MAAGKRRIDGHTVYAALVTALGVSLYWWMFYQAGLSSGRHEERAHIEREHYAADAAKQLEGVCRNLSGIASAECGYQAAETEREGRRNESDLAAQWKAADWVFWAAVIGGAQLIVTAFGLFFIKRTLDANWEAVEAALATTRAFIAIERPRILPGAQATIEADGEIRIRLIVENFGKATGAIHTIEYGGGHNTSWPPESLQMLTLARVHGVMGGTANFLHQEIDMTPEGKSYPYIMGRVTYSSPFAEDHVSYFGFHIEEVGEKTSTGWDATSFHKGAGWPKDT